MDVPRWAQTDNEFKRVCCCALRAFTLQRLAHANRQYAASHREAVERGYLRPAQPSEAPQSLRSGGGDAVFDSDESLDFDALVS